MAVSPPTFIWEGLLRSVRSPSPSEWLTQGKRYEGTAGRAGLEPERPAHPRVPQDHSERKLREHR
jgi:hypothetical protein